MQRRHLRSPSCMLMMIGSLATGSGCGSTNAEYPAPDATAETPPDAAPPDSPPPDAAVVPRCDPAKPFGAPTLVANINSSARDQGAKLLDDLTILFGSDRSGTAGLYMATRSSPASPFGTPVPLTTINSTGAVSGPSPTGDGLTLYYTLTPTANNGEIYVTGRASRSSAFPAGTVVAGINSTSEDLDPSITEDGSTLYFDSARGGVALHLYVAVRQPNGSFGSPQALTNLNTTMVDGHPVLSHDGLTLYWSSTRTDGGAQGVTDIWIAKRTSTAGSFGTPARVPELSSTNGESVSWIAPDDCLVYLQSDRPGGLGLQDIYQAVRPM